MAKLRIGGEEFPLVMTVGVLDQMAVKGFNVKDVPQYYHAKELTWEASINNGIEFLLMVMEAAQISAHIRDGVEPVDLPDEKTLRLILTPPQIFALCDAAILDSLKRTVEAAPGKN